MLRRVFFKVFGIPLIIIAVFVATLPILAGRVNEKQYSPESYIQVIDTLPDNKLVALGDSLPENEVKFEFRKIQIDLSDQKMYLYEGPDVIAEFLVSTGKRGMETPIGEFMVHGKSDRAWSRMAGLWMPYWMVIIPSVGIGIHELPEWPNGYKEGVDHLGVPVSHGCIRLGVGPAEFTYNWAEVGTKVEVVE